MTKEYKVRWQERVKEKCDCCLAAKRDYHEWQECVSKETYPSYDSAESRADKMLNAHSETLEVRDIEVIGTEVNWEVVNA